ncbi:hypothetical protein FXV83_36315 [Bradyrhizobium hipponense]|uniref:TniQ domain-containing protein n=1 Tax=Bradyrhizobium hipponense TaxID=2605638 RepID=A0A5S4YBG2_9BRAD|nr:TniQ family protein [Bradyrhizobium hipponense]TYO61770.1 hypothetical protein FXV83_36315 [Bradyrhizobium hipponense]
MSSTARLVMRSTPRLGESLLGFLLRVSDVNCCTGVPALLRLANLPRTFLTRPCVLKDLASILGGAISLNELEERVYWRAAPKKGIKFVRATVSTVDVNFTHPRVCPACLEEEGIVRQVWDLRVVTACWRHGFYLVDHCSQCGSRLTWRRKRLLQCDCGSELRRQSRDPAPEEVVAFTLLLETQLVNGTNWIDPFPLPLRTLGAICRAIWWFGAELASLERAQPLAISKPRVLVSAKIVERGIECLERWPRSIEELLSQKHLAESNPQSLETTPKHLLYTIRETFRGLHFEPMLDDIRDILGQMEYPTKRNSFYSVRPPKG